MVAIDGNTLIAGAPFYSYFLNDLIQLRTGAAYVYQRQLDGTWAEVAMLPSDPTVLDSDDYFGNAVGISNDTIAVGALGDDDTQAEAGAVYIFERNDSNEDNWEFVTKILGPTEWPGNFGKFLDIDEDTLAVIVEDYSYGYVQLFERDSGGEESWGYIANCGPLELYFWYSVVLEEDWLSVGMPSADPLGLGGEGLVSVFQWSDETNNCIEAARLISPRPAINSNFGNSVEISEDRLIVGEPGADVQLTNDGATYIYHRLSDASTDLAVSIADDPDPVEAGTSVNYTITLNNFGPNDVESVIASFQLSKGVPITTIRSNDGTCNKRERECVFDTLAVGEQVTAVVSAKPRKSGTISLCAEVEAEDSDDPNEANNEACELTIVQ